MKDNKGITFVVWILCFGLSIALLFLIPPNITNAIYVTLIFDIIAFVSQLILWMTGFLSKTEVFYKYPSMTVSTGYLVVQFLLNLGISFTASAISLKIVLILNIILLAVAWILLCLTMSSVSHIQKTDSRQIDHHTKLQ